MSIDDGTLLTQASWADLYARADSGDTLIDAALSELLRLRSALAAARREAFEEAAIRELAEQELARRGIPWR